MAMEKPYSYLYGWKYGVWGMKTHPLAQSIVHKKWLKYIKDVIKYWLYHADFNQSILTCTTIMLSPKNNVSCLWIGMVHLVWYGKIPISSSPPHS